MANVTWNPADKNAAIVLDGTSTAASRTGSDNYAGVRGTVGYTSGTYYFEATVPGGSGAEGSVGLATRTANLSDYLGYGRSDSVTFYNDGNSLTSGNDAYAGSGGYGNRRIGFLVNLTTRRLWIKNDAGAWVIGGDPSGSGAGQNISNLTGALYPAAALYYGNDATTIYAEPGNITLGQPAGSLLWGDASGTPTPTPTPTPSRKPIRYGRWF